MTWKTSNYPADTNPCPHCGKDVALSFDVHEVMMHPDKRNYPQEYLDWKEHQRKEFEKKKQRKKI